jgi:F-type H+-transporting ATPase subunit a
MMFADSGLHISVKAETIFTVLGFHVTNSMILGAIGWILAFWILFRTARNIRAKKYDRLSLAVFWAYEYLLDTAVDALGDVKRGRKLAPLAITMFFFILVNNTLEILPIIGPITWNGVPLFRGVAADLNFTFALAVLTFTTAGIWAVRDRGFFGNLGRYFANPFTKPMHAFEGFLELVAEFSRFIALSMRLFGNIFGGEVLLLVIAFITSYVSVIALPPFMLFELFIGLIQAYIFYMLTVVFVSLGTVGHNAVASEETTSIELAGEAT